MQPWLVHLHLICDLETIMRIHTITILAAAACLLTSCMMVFDNMNDALERGVAVGGTVIDEQDNPIPGIEITMTSYSVSNKNSVKYSATNISAKDGSYSVAILENDPGDFFRITATDPKGVYKDGGIDYIEWDGKVNFLKGQTIVMSK